MTGEQNLSNPTPKELAATTAKVNKGMFAAMLRPARSCLHSSCSLSGTAWHADRLKRKIRERHGRSFPGTVVANQYRAGVTVLTILGLVQNR